MQKITNPRNCKRGAVCKNTCIKMGLNCRGNLTPNQKYSVKTLIKKRKYGRYHSVMGFALLRGPSNNYNNKHILLFLLLGL